MSDRDKRAVIAGGTVVIAAWLLFRGAPGLLDSVARTEARVEQRALVVQRATTRLSRLRELDDSIAALESTARSLSDVLLVGRDDGTATVDLMRRVRGVFSEHRVSLEGFEPREPTRIRTGGLALARLTVRIESDMPGLMELLDHVESDGALGLESVDAVAVDPHADADQAETLAVRIGVSGWFRPEPAHRDTLIGFAR